MAKITLKAIDTAIGAFTTNRDKLRQQAHDIAMMIFYHAAPKGVSDDCQGTGDCTRALKLLEAMPASWAQQMNQWFRDMTPIRINSNAGNVGFDPKYKKETAENKLHWWKLEEANSTPYFEHKAEDRTRIDILDTAKMLKMADQLASRIEKKLQEDEVKPEDEATARTLIAYIRKATAAKIVLDVPSNDEVKAAEEVAA